MHFLPVEIPYHDRITFTGIADVSLLTVYRRRDKETRRKGDKERDFSQESFHDVKELGLMH